MKMQKKNESISYNTINWLHTSIHIQMERERESSTIFRVDGKKVRTSVVETLKSEGHLSDKAKYNCEECVKYTEVNHFLFNK